MERKSFEFVGVVAVYNRVLQLLQTQSKSFLWLTINTYALFFKIPWNCLSLQQTTPFKIAKKTFKYIKSLHFIYSSHLVNTPYKLNFHPASAMTYLSQKTDSHHSLGSRLGVRETECEFSLIF